MRKDKDSTDPIGLVLLFCEYRCVREEGACYVRKELTIARHITHWCSDCQCTASSTSISSPSLPMLEVDNCYVYATLYRCISKI